MMNVQEEELIAVKLRALEAEAGRQLSIQNESELKWFARIGLVPLPNLPRIDHLATMLKVVNGVSGLAAQIFGNPDVVC